MHKSLIALIISCFTLQDFLFSQNTIDWNKTAKVTGVLIDSAALQPTANTIIALLTTSKNQTLASSYSDSTGNFLILAPVGTYQLQFSSLNYGTLVSAPFTITPTTDSLHLNTFYLHATTQMQAVEITVEKALIENKIDRLVYNVGEDATNVGSKVIDMLRKVPMVEVDGDGNVSIRGSSKIRVFINGKPSAALAGSVQDALQAIPADEVEKVEVITNPSAKYDAEGSAGIINLVLKNNKIKGTTGRLRTGIGNRTAYFGANIGDQKGKTGFNIRLGSYFYRAITTSNINRLNTEGSTEYQFTQDARGSNFGGGPRLNIGVDHSFTNFKLLSFSVSGRGSILNQKQDFSSLSGVAFQPLNYLYNRSVQNNNFGFGLDATLNYLIKSKAKMGREYNFGLQYGGDNSFTNYQSNQYNYTTLTYSEKSINTAINSEFTAQFDFTEPTKKGLFETGLKSIVRILNSDYSFDSLQIQSNNYLPIKARNNTFTYNQNVYSAYAQYEFKLYKSITMRLGLRGEQTTFNGSRADTALAFKGKPYLNFIPYILLNKNIGKAGFIKFSYTNRVQRPGLFYINPYINQSDPRNITVGNPSLNAEITSNYELNLGNYSRKGGAMVSLYNRNTNNAIESLRQVLSSGIYFTTYGNIGKSSQQGLDLNANFNTKKVKLNINGGVGYIQIKSTSNNSIIAGLKTTGFTYNLSLRGGYEFKNNLEISGFARINAPSFSLQGYTTNWYFHTVGIKKRFKNKKGGIGLGVDNPFTPTVRYKTVNQGNNFIFTDNKTAYQLGIKINFDYRFGKLEMEDNKPKFKDIKNTDIKPGQNQNPSGGGD